MISSVDPAAMHLHPGVVPQLGQLTAQMTQLQLNHPNATVSVNNEGTAIFNNSQFVCLPEEAYEVEPVNKDVSQEFLPPPPGFSTADKFQSQPVVNDSAQHVAVVPPQYDFCELSMKPVDSVCALPVVGGIQFGVPYITCQDGLYPLMSQSIAVPANNNASGSIVLSSSDVVV